MYLLTVQPWPLQCVKYCPSDWKTEEKIASNVSSEIRSWPTGSCSLLCSSCTVFLLTDGWLLCRMLHTSSKKTTAINCNKITILMICINILYQVIASLWLPNQIQYIFHYIISLLGLHSYQACSQMVICFNNIYWPKIQWDSNRIS